MAALDLGGLIEFDSKNDFVLDRAVINGRAALSGRAADLNGSGTGFRL